MSSEPVLHNSVPRFAPSGRGNPVTQVWTLKRGIIDPPEPLEEEHSDWIKAMWWVRDNPLPLRRESERQLLNRWREEFE